MAETSLEIESASQLLLVFAFVLFTVTVPVLIVESLTGTPTIRGAELPDLLTPQQIRRLD
jgi:hypothetical protein